MKAHKLASLIIGIALAVFAMRGTAWTAEVTGTAADPTSLTITQNDSGTFSSQITQVNGNLPSNKTGQVTYCNDWTIDNSGNVTCTGSAFLTVPPGVNYGGGTTFNPPISGTVTVNVASGAPCTAPNNVFTINETFTGSQGLETDASDTRQVTVTVQCAITTLEGCSHGFWKNHAGEWQSYNTNQTLGSVFTMGSAYAGMSGNTLFEALSFTGGPTLEDMAKILMLQGVAAVLNAAHSSINYPIATPALVITDVNNALANAAAAGSVENGRDILESLKDTLEGYQTGPTAVCPLPE